MKAWSPAGSSPAFALFRYEVRCWRHGAHPGVGEAVDSPQRLAAGALSARRVIDLVPAVPALLWGRDESHTGDMWNSNSVIAWLLVRSRIDPRLARLPARGRAPVWDAGVVLAGAGRVPASGA